LPVIVPGVPTELVIVAAVSAAAVAVAAPVLWKRRLREIFGVRKITVQTDAKRDRAGQ
jgi:hypothetical protein